MTEQCPHCLSYNYFWDSYYLIFRCWNCGEFNFFSDANTNTKIEDLIQGKFYQDGQVYPPRKLE